MAQIDIFGELHAATAEGIVADISQIRGAGDLGNLDELKKQIKTAQDTANNALPKSGGTMTGRLVVNKAGTTQTDSAAGHIAFQKNGTEYAHFRLPATNSNLAIESKGGIILYGGAGDNGTAFSGANYVSVYSGSLRGVGTVDLTGFRNFGLSGTISHGSATLTLPSSTGTLALTSYVDTKVSAATATIPITDLRGA